MRNRKPLIAAMLGGTCTIVLLAAPSSGQQPSAKQRSPSEAETTPAATQSLQLPPEQPVVELTVQSPGEVHVGRSFEYQIRVQNNSTNIAVHDLVISQLAGEGFEIESAKVQGDPAAQRDEAADKQQQKARDKQKQNKQNAEAEGQSSKSHESDNEGTDEKELAGKQRQSESDVTESKRSEAGEPKSKSSQSNSSDGESDAKPAQSNNPSSKREKAANKGQHGAVDGSRWKIARLMPGESRTIVVTASSDSEGAGNACIAVESYTPALCLTTRFTKPELEIVKQAPEVAVICDEITFNYLVRNTGSGDLQRFTVRDKLPKGLQTVDGDESLEFTLDDGLKSGETRKFAARLRATTTGDFTSRATVEGSEGIEARSNLTGTKVQKADLALAIEGPRTQELGGLANYTVRVTNRGDATAPGTQLRVYFPRSADLVRAGKPQPSSRTVEASVAHALGSDNEQASHQHGTQTEGRQATDRVEESDGDKKADAAEQAAESQQDPNEKQQGDQKSEQDDDPQKSEADEQSQSKKEPSASGDARDEARRAQNRENQQRGDMAQHGWQLGSLAPGQTVEVTYTLRPYERGRLDQAAVAEYACATTQNREMLRAETETRTEILMLPGLRLTAVDDHDPVRTGENVTYTIAVLNQGNAPAHNVTVHAKLPKQVKFVEAKGATAGEKSEEGVAFEPIKALEPGKRVVWQLVASVNAGVGESTQDSIAVTLDSADLQETITSEEPTTFFEVEQRTARSTDSESKATEKK